MEVITKEAQETKGQVDRMREVRGQSMDPLVLW